ncbi:uncharacterized protein LOC128553483 [Mercenaria mercenaria]|uniref:uncharacterized protein LOC128553483 n=1 Tax=Mercenaria mercenaria TaxID=6596 RepID=UPI00234F6493|nr:uncharacterized protein LOC128553483 [Mercenaria mercenaria]
MSLSRPGGNPSPSAKDKSLNEINAFLLDQALSPASHQTYEKAYRLFQQFSRETLKCATAFPASVPNLLLFIAHCYKIGFAPTTTSTYISAIGYYHKLHQMPDLTTSFLIKKTLQWFHNNKKQIDKRLPITTHVLCRPLDSLSFINTSYFIRTMLKAMYLVAFHAFLRVGEIAATGKMSDNTLSVTDVTFIYSGSQLEGFELRMSKYKHCKGDPKVLFVKANHSAACPVAALKEYLHLRRASSGPVFGFMDGTAVSRTFFSTQLKLSLNWAGLAHARYKGHSFRIGAASSAAQQSFSEETIKLMGRWSPDAFKKYIRIPMLEL